MSGLIVKIIRRAAFVGILGSTAYFAYDFIQRPDSSAVIQSVKTSPVVKSVKTTAETGAHWTADQTDEVRKKLEHLDIERKMGDLQDKARPIGQKITDTVGPSFNPVRQGERRMSLPALMLIFVFGFVFLLMGRASTGGGRY